MVFGSWSYIALAGVVSFTMFVLATWLPNFRLLRSVWLDPSVSYADKIVLPVRLLESITTNFSVLSASYTMATVVLVGVNIAFVAYILQRQKQQLSAAGVTAGTFGILSGAAGVGCAACGSLAISALLATAGGAGIVALLPLRGGEFGILGVAFLCAAMYYLAKHIARPTVCGINSYIT